MLREIYRSYLDSEMRPQDARPLAEALIGSSFHQEGALLKAYSESGPGYYVCRDSGGDETRAFVGAVPPDARPGAWWLDTCDLSLMILLPQYVDPEDEGSLSPEACARTEENRTWFSVRPVLRYQIAAFLDVAGIERLDYAASVLDPIRLLAGDECSPITRISTTEAGLYLSWAGKFFATDSEWSSIRNIFRMSPWSAVPREWTGLSAVNDDFCVTVSEEILAANERAGEDGDWFEGPLYQVNDEAPEITLRSALPLVYGFWKSSNSAQFSKAGVRIARNLPRHAQVTG